MRIVSDLHTHTVYSHGHGTPEANVLRAMELGLERVAITEHARGHLFYGVRGERLLRLRREVDALAARYAGRIEVLLGLESNLTAFGECDAPLPGDGDRALFDIVFLAYHRGVIPRDALSRRLVLESSGSGRPHPADTANALLAAAEKYRVDALAHPCQYVEADMMLLSNGARELGVLLEINANHVSLSEEDLRCAATHGASFIVSSDAHEPGRVGDFSRALAAAAAAGIGPERIVNAAGN